MAVTIEGNQRFNELFAALNTHCLVKGSCFLPVIAIAGNMQCRICREMFFIPLSTIWGTFESIAWQSGLLRERDSAEIGLESLLCFKFLTSGYRSPLTTLLFVSRTYSVESASIFGILFKYNWLQILRFEF